MDWSRIIFPQAEGGLGIIELEIADLRRANVETLDALGSQHVCFKERWRVAAIILLDLHRNPSHSAIIIVSPHPPSNLEALGAQPYLVTP